MLGHPRGDGQDVGVEDDVLRRKARLLRQEAVGTRAHLDATLAGIRLPLFVEGHHYHGGTVAAQGAGVQEEFLLAFLQRYGVDYTLSLHTLQPRLDDPPIGRIEHHGDTGDIRLGGDEVEEIDHLRAGIQEAVVHVDVDDLRPIFHLLAGDTEGFVVFLLVDEAEELARTGHVAALAYVDKIILRFHLQHIQSGQTQVGRLPHRHVQLGILHQVCESGDVFIGGAAASAKDIYQSFFHKRTHFPLHVVGCLIV